MRKFTAVLHEGETDEGGYWATCLEVPGANGQGESKAECLEDLAAAIKLVLEYHEEQALRDDPKAEMTELAIA